MTMTIAIIQIAGKATIAFAFMAMGLLAWILSKSYWRHLYWTKDVDPALLRKWAWISWGSLALAVLCAVLMYYSL